MLRLRRFYFEAKSENHCLGAALVMQRRWKMLSYLGCDQELSPALYSGSTEVTDIQWVSQQGHGVGAEPLDRS